MVHNGLLFLILGFLIGQSEAASHRQFIELLLEGHQFFEKERLSVKIKQLEKDKDYANYANWHQNCKDYAHDDV